MRDQDPTPSGHRENVRVIGREDLRVTTAPQERGQ